MTHKWRSGPVRDERGDIVLSWLSRVAAVILAVGVVSFDAISVGATSLVVSDQATHAAHEASSAWQTTPNRQQAFQAAVQAAAEQNEANVVDPRAFVVDPDGTIHVRVTREANTLLAKHVPALRPYLTITRTESARSIVS